MKFTLLLLPNNPGLSLWIPVKINGLTLRGVFCDPFALFI